MFNKIVLDIFLTKVLCYAVKLFEKQLLILTTKHTAQY